MTLIIEEAQLENMLAEHKNQIISMTNELWKDINKSSFKAVEEKIYRIGDRFKSDNKENKTEYLLASFPKNDLSRFSMVGMISLTTGNYVHHTKLAVENLSKITEKEFREIESGTAGFIKIEKP